MSTEKEAEMALKHHGDKMFKDDLNISYAAVATASGQEPTKDNYVIQTGLIEEVFSPAGPVTKEFVASFGIGAQPSMPTELAIPDEHGFIGENPDTVPIETVVVGQVTPQVFDQRVRPANGGNSCGNVRYENAGTLVAAFRFEGSLHIVSNWHVFYGPAGQNGDHIIQPGRGDGGQSPADAVALNVYGVFDQLRDFTIASVPAEYEHQIGLGTRCFRPLAGVRGAAPGMLVKKCGRTSESTFGQVLSTYAWVRVSYPWGTYLFVDQLMLTAMSFPGDSGSLVQTYDTNEVVRMVFAGGSAATFANKSENIFVNSTKTGTLTLVDMPGRD